MCSSTNAINRCLVITQSPPVPKCTLMIAQSLFLSQNLNFPQANLKWAKSLLSCKSTKETAKHWHVFSPKLQLSSCHQILQLPLSCVDLALVLFLSLGSCKNVLSRKDLVKQFYTSGVASVILTLSTEMRWQMLWTKKSFLNYTFASVVRRMSPRLMSKMLLLKMKPR